MTPTSPRAVPGERVTDGASLSSTADGHSPAREERPLRLREVYPGSVADGRVIRGTSWDRLIAWLHKIATSAGERREADLNAQLINAERVSRTNVIAVVSPKGGVGKTTVSFLLACLLATYVKLRALAIDTNRDFGTLGSLVPERNAVRHSAVDLLSDMDGLRSATEVSAYVAALPSGAHILQAPRQAEAMLEMTPELYGKIVEFVAQYYDCLVLDLGTGIVDPLSSFAIRRADHIFIVTEPLRVTTDKVRDAVGYIRSECGDDRPLTAVINYRTMPSRDTNVRAIEDALRELKIRQQLVLPHDEQMTQMLDTGSYNLEALERTTRVSIKRAGLAAVERLV